MLEISEDEARRSGRRLTGEAERVHWSKWIIAVCVIVQAGWMAFDGGRALIVGDYVTPSKGEYAGQLGPWSRVVSAVGIEPRGTPMKMIFLTYGLVWLAIGVAFVLGASWAWWAMIVLAIGALWYLPFGTLLSLIQIVLLILMRSRAAGG